MSRHFEDKILELKEQLLAMSGQTERIIRKAVEALHRRDRALAEEVFADDHAIDRLEIDIEERCVRLLALQQPLATDLRFITAALKISNDLERVGDHAVNIAGSTLRLADQPLLKPLVDIPRMADLASGHKHRSDLSIRKRRGSSNAYGEGTKRRPQTNGPSSADTLPGPEQPAEMSPPASLPPSGRQPLLTKTRWLLLPPRLASLRGDD